MKKYITGNEYKFIGFFTLTLVFVRTYIWKKETYVGGEKDEFEYEDILVYRFFQPGTCGIIDYTALQMAEMKMVPINAPYRQFKIAYIDNNHVQNKGRTY